MKIFIAIRILFLSILVYSHACAQWTWQNPLPQGHELTVVKGIDSLRCCAAGLFGTIMTTKNGGKSWHIFSDSAKRWIEGVDFTDSLHGWAVGLRGFRFSTDDGGITWSDHSTDSLDWFTSVTFADPLHGWMCNEWGPDTRPKILRTSDGGLTWNACPCPATAYPSVLRFIDPHHGWFCDGTWGSIFRTSDGGNTWVKRDIGGGNSEPTDLWFSDTLHGCCVYESSIFYTSDGGDHWVGRDSLHLYAASVTMDGMNVIYTTGFTTNNSGITYHARSAKSADAGLTWSYNDFEEPENENSISLASPVTYDSRALWQAGRGGNILRSLNGSQSWQWMTRQAPLANITSIYFDKTFPVGWASTGSGYIMKSRDGGVTWNRMPTCTTNPLTSVCFTDTLKGFAVGQKGTLVRTTDGGITWTQAMTAVPANDYVAVCFPDPLHGWTISGNGAVIRTVDGGNTWARVGTVYGDEVYDFTFIDSRHGWSVGNWGNIRVTRDGGVHWSIQTSHVEITQIWDVCFTDSLYGWCAVGRGYKIHTTDGGKTWLVDGSIYQDAWDHYAVKFFDHYNGYMTGEYDWPYTGFILRTSDGGVTWKEEQTTIGNTVYNLFANDSTAVYGAGRSGTIIRHAGGVLQDISLLENRHSMQCYPNPCKESFFIKMTLAEQQPVSVQVFDCRGNLVLVLTERTFPAGDQVIPVSLEGLPDGTYLFRVVTAGGARTGKMVKLN